MFLDDPDPAEAIAGWTLRASATFTPQTTGEHRFRIKTLDEAALLVDGEPVGEVVSLEAGRPVQLVVEAQTANPAGRLAVELRMAVPEPPDAFERAVAAAAAADAAVVVIGLDGDWETEGRDRDHLELPGRQVELVRAVAAAQPRTVVAVVAGAPVDLSWATRGPCRAVVLVPRPGGWPGHGRRAHRRRRARRPPALHDAAAHRGHARLPRHARPIPASCATRRARSAGTAGTTPGCCEPAFPFGHGLGYTTFDLGPPELDPDPVAAGSRSRRRGAGHEHRAIEPAPRWSSSTSATTSPASAAPHESCRAFAKVHLAAGETTRVRFVLGPRELAFWDTREGCWRAEAGSFSIWAGRSSRDLTEPARLVLAERLDRAAVVAGRRRRCRAHRGRWPMRGIRFAQSRWNRASESARRVVSPRRRDAMGLSAAALAWVGGIVFVAVAGQAVVVQRVDRGPDHLSPATDEIVSPEVIDDLPAGFLGNVTQRDIDGLLDAFTTSTTAPDYDLGVSEEIESGEVPKSILPELPVIELPPLPEELDPILEILGPSARTVCSTTGVVIVLTALLKGDLEGAGVPVSQALTYLGPILSACALFPQGEPSICAVDAAINNAVIPKDLQILVGVPPLAALGLDQVDAVVGALASTGVPIPPGTSEAVADALGCELR